jgi:hypothetical protein
LGYHRQSVSHLGRQVRNVIGRIVDVIKKFGSLKFRSFDAVWSFINPRTGRDARKNPFD